MRHQAETEDPEVPGSSQVVMAAAAGPGPCPRVGVLPDPAAQVVLAETRPLSLAMVVAVVLVAILRAQGPAVLAALVVLVAPVVSSVAWVTCPRSRYQSLCE